MFLHVPSKSVLTFHLLLSPTNKSNGGATGERGPDLLPYMKIFINFKKIIKKYFTQGL